MNNISRRVVSVLAAAVLCLSIENVLAEKYTPTKNEKISVSCSCLSPVGGSVACALEIFDKAAHSSIHSWDIYQHGLAGKEIDLTKSCYRKRNEEGLGEGACCTVLNDDPKAIERLYSGVKQLLEDGISN